MRDHDLAFLRPIRLRIGRSRYLAVVAAAVHLGAAVIAYLLPLPPWWRLAVLGAVMWSAWRVYRVHLRRDGEAVRDLLVRNDGVFEITTASGTHGATLASAEVVEPWLTVLRLRRVDGTRISVVLLRDNVEAQQFRRLRVRLRRPNPPRGDAGAARGGGS
ncbi:MAG: protein YgfX [Chromatiales bacterium]